ncbi:MAG: DUF4919 domain-containing protein [Chloroflexi bacterium]|nr:DUF4919 domain-containing protein [Chloroflexota bacterium]
MPDYLELARQAQENPSGADFIALREAYVASGDYRPTSHYSSGKLIGTTNGLDSFESVVEFCTTMLDQNPMDLEVRLLLEYTYEQLNNTENARRQHDFIRGMIEAIYTSGDGKSFESALKVVAVAEEYTLLSLNGLKLKFQQLIEHDGRRFDVLTCTRRNDEDGPEIILYFDITDPFSYLQNMLE